jgi:hypothetical protein
MRWPGANRSVRVSGAGRLQGTTSYFQGADQEKWRTGIPHFSRVRYDRVYDGIDVEFYGNQRDIEFDFIVRRGADPAKVRLAFDGQDSVSMADGEVILSAGESTVRLRQPVAYQETPGGGRRAVAAQYRRDAAGILGFELGPYDPALDLVIDPVLVYSTYFGGTGMDEVRALATDSSSNAYLTGVTTSLNFGTLPSTFTAGVRGNKDVFVAKINAEGTSLLYLAIVGGSGDDEPKDIAVSPIPFCSPCAATIAGGTASSDWPTTAGALSVTPGSNSSFVMRLSTAGTGFVYSTYAGNNGPATALAVDGSDSAHLTLTDSSSSRIKVLNSTGTAVLAEKGPYAGLFFADIALGHVVTGRTNGDPSVIPSSATQRIGPGGGEDAFVLVLRNGETAQVFSDYSAIVLGGSGSDVGTSLQVVHNTGVVHLAGSTMSGDLFPNGATGYQTAHAGGWDGFFAYLTLNGVLSYSTYFGGSGDDRIESVVGGWVTGRTTSTNLPMRDAFQAVSGGGTDAFVATFHPLLPGAQSLLYSSYFGGPGTDVGYAIGVLPDTTTIVAGSTGGGIPVAGAMQPTSGGSTDGFVANVGRPLFPFMCYAQAAATPSVRSSGLTELLGETILSCSGGTAGTARLASLELTTSPAIPITSRILSINFASEALLFLNEPVPNAMVVQAAGQTVVGANVIQGQQPGGAILRFDNVPIVEPGEGPPLILRIVNVRANVASLGVPAGQQASVSVSISSPDLGGPIVNATFAVAVVANGLSTSLRNPGNPPAFSLINLPCSGHNPTVTSNTPADAIIRFDEALPAAFKNRNVAITDANPDPGAAVADQNVLGFLRFNETGFFHSGFPPTNGLNVAGLAQSGTRLMLRFTGVPSGVRVWVTSSQVESTYLSNGTASAIRGLRTSTDVNGAGVYGMLPATNGPYSEVAISEGTGIAVWEVAGTPSVDPERLTFAIALSAGANASLGEIRIEAGFAPMAIAAAPNGLPTPRFLWLPATYTLATTGCPATPQANSITPSSGSGSTQTFQVTYSDPNGHADIHSVRLLVAPQVQGANACYLYYTKSDNRLYLHSDSGTALLPGIPVHSGTLQNSQCSVTGGSASASGNNLTLNLTMTFAPGFPGNKTLFGFAHDLGGRTSEWQALGTWTVPGEEQPAPSPVPPQVVSTVPASGSGSTQTFRVKYSDPNGHADIHSVRFLIAPPGQGASAWALGANACYVYYTKSDNRIYLHNDSGNALLPGISLGSGTTQNSQCSLNGAASSAAAYGNDLTLDLTINFTQAFGGNKSLFGYARDVGGLTADWIVLGAWNVPGGLTPPPASAPQVVSITPASPSPATETLSVTYWDDNGHADIHSVRLLINTQNQGANACYLYYTKADNRLYLHSDSGTALLPGITLGSGTLQNSQCSVNGAASSVAASANSLTLTLAITLPASFSGPKSVYGFAHDNGGLTSGWTTLGSWNVPGGFVGPTRPQVLSVTPSSGSGFSQIFRFRFADANGYADLEYVTIMFGKLHSPGGCVVSYLRSENRLELDINGVASPPLTPGGTASARSDACTLTAQTSAVSFAGNDLTLDVAIAFELSYAGAKDILAVVSDSSGLETGWQAVGTWNVPGTTYPPQAFTANPASGSGASQTFSFLYTDLNGIVDLQEMRVLIHSQHDHVNSCSFYYRRSTNDLYLVKDAGDGLLDPVKLGQPGVIRNSQCAVNAANSSGFGSFNYFHLQLAISFNAGYGGDKVIRSEVVDRQGLTSGWVIVGNWNVPSGTQSSPQAISAQPSSGAASSRTFEVAFADPNGHADIHSARVLINSQMQGANACYLYYTKADNRLYLHNDSGTALVPGITPGSGTLQNSQCSVDGAGSSAVASGNSLTLRVAITFPPSFAGAKTIYGFVHDVGGLTSGWQALGTWSVPGGVPPPPPVAPPQPLSITPNSGGTSSQLFAVTYADANGHADIHSVRLLFAPQVQGASACYLYYTKADNRLYLHSDDGNALLAGISPGSGTLQNSQCSVNGSGSSAFWSGDTLTLNLALTFTASFSGSKNIYGFAHDTGGLTSHWITLGTWVVPSVLGPSAPQANSITPSSGSGSSQIFNIAYSDPNGHADIHSVRLLFNSQNQGANSCYLYFTKSDNRLYLHSDAGNALLQGIAIGSGTLQNSQCTVNGSASSVSVAGNQITLNLAISFAPSFAGAKTAYAFAHDFGGLVSNWQALGTWTIP